MVVRTSVDPKLERAERLVTLLDHPNWDELRAASRDQMERKFNFLTSRMMSPQGVTEDERQYWRGYFAGMKFLLDQPGISQSKLDKAYQESQKDDERN